MWQYLDGNTINAIRGKTATFGFWFYPEFIPSGSESDPLGQATSTSGWFISTELVYTPPQNKGMILRKVQLDTYVNSGRGYYKITYQMAGEEEMLLVSDQEVTNTVQETREHEVFVCGEEGQSITVKFYIGRYQGSGMIWSRNHYMYYQVPVSARAEIYYEYSSGSDTVYGTWVAPTELQWYNAYVMLSLPLTISLVKVIVHGMNDFKAWIGKVLFSIFDYKNQEGEYGSFNLGVNLFSYRRDPGMALDGIARLVPSVYAEAYNGTWPSGEPKEYKIHWIELKVTVVEGDSCNLYIDHAGQENNEGEEIDPEATERQQEEAIFAVSILVTFVAGVTISYGVGLLLELAAVESAAIGVLSRTTISTTFGALLRRYLPYYASDPIQESGTCVWENWGYPWISLPSKDTFVEAAGTHFDLNWFFDTNSGTDFKIYIESTICWAIKSPVLNQLGLVVYYELIDEATWNQGIVVHIQA